MNKVTLHSAKWRRCLEIYKANTDEQTFNSLFAHISFDALDTQEHTVTLGVQSYFIVESLEKDNRLKTLLHSALWREFQDRLKIRYRILTDSTSGITTDVEAAAGPISEAQIDQHTKKVKQTQSDELESRLNEQYTFDNFIQGEANVLLRTIGMSIADNTAQRTFNPLFVYGSSGVGKTHLVNAIGIRYKRYSPEKRVLYVSAHDFKVQYTSAKIENRINDFIYFYQTIDVLIIDDIQLIAGNTATLNAFFHIFNHLKMNKKQVIITCDQAPADVPGLEARLISRFTWGLCEELGKPDEELYRKILEKRIQQNGMQLSQEVINYIVQNISFSIRDLEGILSSLIAYSLVLNRDIDMNIARQVISKTKKTQKTAITIELILDSVCRYYNISQEELVSKCRKANIALVRQLAMYLANKYTKLTISKIGLYIGGRNHATVIHSIKQIQYRQETDQLFRQQVEDLEEDLKH